MILCNAKLQSNVMDRLKRMRKIRNTLEDKDRNQIKNINKLILMNVIKNNILNNTISRTRNLYKEHNLFHK